MAPSVSILTDLTVPAMQAGNWGLNTLYVFHSTLINIIEGTNIFPCNSLYPAVQIADRVSFFMISS